MGPAKDFRCYMPKMSDLLFLSKLYKDSLSGKWKWGQNAVETLYYKDLPSNSMLQMSFFIVYPGKSNEAPSTEWDTSQHLVLFLLRWKKIFPFPLGKRVGLILSVKLDAKGSGIDILHRGLLGLDIEAYSGFSGECDARRPSFCRQLRSL